MALEKKLDAAANAAAVITAVAPRYLHWLLFSYSGSPTGGRLTVVVASTTYLDVDITAAGPQLLRLDPVFVNPGTGNVVITLAAAGSGVTGKLMAMTS